MRQFIVVNNGMTEMRGHFMETAVSMIEAARAAGFRPVLALHRECPVAELPEWIDCLPFFRTDHWGNVCPLGPPQSDGLRGDRRVMLDVPITAGVGEYLQA